jgi:hypothetical protein
LDQRNLLLTVRLSSNARRQSPALAGKWLGSMAAREAARELLDNTDLLQQRQVLLRMKPHRAATLLEVSLHFILSSIMLEIQTLYLAPKSLLSSSCGKLSSVYLIAENMICNKYRVCSSLTHCGPHD